MSRKININFQLLESKFSPKPWSFEQYEHFCIHPKIKNTLQKITMENLYYYYFCLSRLSM